MENAKRVVAWCALGSIMQSKTTVVFWKQRHDSAFPITLNQRNQNEGSEN
jgi:hypothetical protein